MPTLIGKIEPGDVIGRCRIIRELGRGGVGTVYLATHQTLQIEVALKILSPSLSLENPALAERFIREAQLAARIRHPNVIAVMDAAHDEVTGLYFIVLEYVGGGSLSWHLRNGPVPEAKGLAIVTGIAHALVIAEENSIVHRDIKPDNIMLDLRGTSKLADLGLAKHAIDSRTSLTLGGSFMGTPAYMSPEQARDAKVADTRDDIYSLGATFFECLTGAPPFQGETPYNIMSELLTKPSPSPRAHRPEVSRSVDLICRKMMAKTRELRYGDARALLRDLQHCQTFGDSGLDKLEAATFEQDSIMARQQARTFGVETSADGVAVVPELPGDSESGPITKPVPALIAPRRVDYGVFRAAALLVVLVVVATLLLAWAGPHHSFSFVKNGFALISGNASSQASPPAETPTNSSPSPSTASTHAPGPSFGPIAPVNPPADPAPVIPDAAVVSTAPPPALLPARSGAVPDEINPAPVLPTESAEASPSVTPAFSATPDSAFEARAIAEGRLATSDIDGTGQARLLTIIGKRDKSEMTPTMWTFYFYDESAARNARIVTVKDHKVVKNDDTLFDTDHLLSYKPQEVFPNDKLATDSSQALLTAQGLLRPGVTVSSSEFELTQKGSIPAWKVTLWAKNKDGEDEKLGAVTILAEKNVVSNSTLNPEWVAQR
jgi:serine/threonine protein kinase